MAFTEAERVKIRRYLGYSRRYVSSDPRLESAITTIQSTADGGSFPDSTSEAEIRTILAALATVETQLDECSAAAMALRDGDSEIDFGYRFQVARTRGRMLVGSLSDVLEISPIRDIFSPKRSAPLGGPYQPRM